MDSNTYIKDWCCCDRLISNWKRQAKIWPPRMKNGEFFKIHDRDKNFEARLIKLNTTKT